jgi:uncharacterized membrane protein YfcA
MWKEYKRRFFVSQVLIVVVALLAWQVGKMEARQLITIIVAMEIGGLLGAWMGAKMKQQIERADEDLPLNKR